ncbi:cadherin-like domain-containing protein [Candidatus Woesearchaeota archaeon]|nr:cadherin-like domain-containing protein [Candidatus Woesearchaeota archaeon]
MQVQRKNVFILGILLLMTLVLSTTAQASTTLFTQAPGPSSTPLITLVELNGSAFLLENNYLSVTLQDPEVDIDTVHLSLFDPSSNMIVDEDISLSAGYPVGVIYKFDSSIFSLSVTGTWSINITANDSVNHISTQIVTFNVVVKDDAAVWSPLSDQNINEDSVDGTVVYSNLKSLCTDVDTPIKTFTASTISPYFDVYFSALDNDLRVENISSNVNSDDVGFQQVTVYCNGVGSSFDVYINSINDDPTLALMPAQTIDEDTLNNVLPLDLATYASDVDGDSLTFTATGTADLSAVAIPDGLGGVYITVSTLTPNFYGDVLVDVTVSDGNGGSASRSLTVHVNDVDETAVWAPLSDQNIPEDSFDGTIIYPNVESLCTDVDNPTKTLVATTTSPYFDVYFSAFDDELRIANLTANINGDSISPQPIELFCNGVGTSFDLTIDPVNDNPLFGVLPAQTIDEDSVNVVLPLDLATYASDVDGDSLTFTATGVPELSAVANPDGLGGVYLTVNSLSANFYGDVVINIDVTDGNGGLTSQGLLIHILNVDDAAVLNLPASLSVNEDSDDGTVVLSNVNSVCTDVDSPVVVSATDTSSFYDLQIVGSDLVINSLDADYNDVVGTAVNFNCNGVLGSTLLYVQPVNDNPIINGFTGATTASEYSLVQLTIDASDIDLDTLSYSVINPVGDMSFTGNVFSWTPQTSDVGVTNVNIEVTDGLATDNITIPITVFRNVDFDNILITTPNFAPLVDVQDGDNIGFLMPGDTMTIDLDLINSLSDGLSDMTITAQISGVDVDQTPQFNLAAGSNTSKSLSLNVPYSVASGNNNLVLTASGYSTDGLGNNFPRQVVYTMPISINKDSRKIIIQQESFTPSTVTCVRDTTLSFELVNIGFNDETTANTLTVTIPGIDSWQTTNVVVPAGSTNNAIQINVPLTVPYVTPPGSYNAQIQFVYDNGVSTANATYPIVVDLCPVPASLGTYDEDEVIGTILDLNSIFADSYYNNLVYSVSSQNPSLVSCSENAGWLSCSLVGDAYGSANIDLTYSEAGYSNTVSIPMAVNPINDNPVLSFAPTYTIDEDTVLTINWNALVSDVDNSDNQLQVSLIGDSAFSFNVTPTEIKVTPNHNWYGTGVVSVQVTDPLGGFAQTSFDLTVNSLQDDSPEILQITPNVFDIASPEDNGFVENFNVLATDPDEAEILTITWFVDGLQVKNSVAFQDSIDLVSDGTEKNHTVQLFIADDDGHQINRTWRVEQRKTPRSYLYTSSIFSLNATQIENVSSFVIRGSDTILTFAPGQNFNLSRTVDFDRFFNLSNGVAAIDTNRFTTFNGADAHVQFLNLNYAKEPILYYNPAYMTTGGVECNSVLCLNPVWSRVADTYTFDVLGFSSYYLAADPANYAPEITSTPITSVREKEDYEYEVKAVDYEGDTMIFSLTQAPSGMGINPITGVISWSNFEMGDYDVTVQVTDVLGHSATQSYSIEVLPPNGLEITDLEYSILGGDQDESLRDGETIYLKPGDQLTLNVAIENILDSDYTLDKVKAEFVIQGINDGEDVDLDKRISDMDGGDEQDVELIVNIPFDADEDSYSAILTITAEDEFNFKHEAEIEFDVEVEKENEDLYIYFDEDTLRTINCETDYSIPLRIYNIGLDDINYAQLVVSSDLIPDEYTRIVSLSESTNRYFSVPLTVDEDTPTGINEVYATISYGGDVLHKITIPVNVGSCPVRTTTATVNNKATPLTPSIYGKGGPVISTKKQSYFAGDFRGSTLYYVLIFAAWIIALALFLFVYAYIDLIQKRKRRSKKLVKKNNSQVRR